MKGVLCVALSAVLTTNLIVVQTFPITSYAKDKKTVMESIMDTSSAAQKAAKKAGESAKKAGKKISDTAQSAGEEVANTAKTLTKMTAKTAPSISENLQDEAKNFKASNVEQGWKLLSRLNGAQLASRELNKNTKPIADAIETMRKDLETNTCKTRPADKEKGFVFEKWQADTFNIDAKAKHSAETAEWLPPEGVTAKEDMSTSYGEKASMKAYQDGEKSAVAQSSKKGAKALQEKYQEFNQKRMSEGKEDITLQEYVDNELSTDEVEDLFASSYEGQTRIILADQMDDAKRYLEGKTAELDMPDQYSTAQRKVYQETLDGLKDHLEAPDGTKSKPLTSEQLQVLTEMSQSGDVDMKKLADKGFDGVRVSDYLTRAELASQVVDAGLQGAALSVALEIEPDVYVILKDALKDGNVSDKDLKKMGLDAALAGTSGFSEGAIGQLILR